MQKQKKIPVRMCLGCGQKQPKKELIRIVRTVDNEFKMDFTGRLNGRGCYICKNTACMESVVKQKKLAKSFEMPVEPEVYEKLKNEFGEWFAENGGKTIG